MMSRFLLFSEFSTPDGRRHSEFYLFFDEQARWLGVCIALRATTISPSTPIFSLIIRTST